VVNWYGITDIEMVDEYLNTRDANRNYARAWAGTAQKIAEVSAAYSPLYLISDQAPPIISIHGTNDTVVPYEQGEALHASLNTPNELVTLAGGTHGGFTDAQHIEAFTRIFAFIDAH
jgi:dipeptidyl aminopeptidase/acylaminoacyl peptidase